MMCVVRVSTVGARLGGLRALGLRLIRSLTAPGLAGGLLLLGGHRKLPSRIAVCPKARCDPLHGLALWHNPDLHFDSLDMFVAERPRIGLRISVTCSVRRRDYS